MTRGKVGLIVIIAGIVALVGGTLIATSQGVMPGGGTGNESGGVMIEAPARA